MGKYDRNSAAGVMLFCVMVLGLSASSCSKSVPKCDSGKAVDAVIYAVGQDIRKDLSGVAGMSGSQLSDDEWRMFRAGMMITMDNMKELVFDEGSNKRTCSGSVTIQNSGKTNVLPVTYVEELDAAGELKVSVSGLEARRGDASKPIISDKQ